jgi:hypothetical protein
VSVVGKLGIPPSAPGITKLIADRIIPHDAIAIRAFDISKSGAGGSQDDHWFQAERRQGRQAAEGHERLANGSAGGSRFESARIQSYSQQAEKNNTGECWLLRITHLKTKSNKGEGGTRI